MVDSGLAVNRGGVGAKDRGALTLDRARRRVVRQPSSPAAGRGRHRGDLTTGPACSASMPGMSQTGVSANGPPTSLSVALTAGLHAMSRRPCVGAELHVARVTSRG